MPTTTKKNPEAERQQRQHEGYDRSVAVFATALEQFHKRDYDAARRQFLAIVESADDEPALVERALSYARVCGRRLDGPPAEPTTADERYLHAVVRSNAGQLDAALALLDRLLEDEPGSVRALYARASTWAMRRNADAAVADLRRAIQSDPRVRFQAVNDPDFESIREEPAFIDLIEPSPTGT
jgi:predicted Zn-dependent protease